MNEYNHRTDMFGSRKVVAVGKQKTHWIEFQLLDEQGVPLVNMPYTATNEATRCGLVPVFTGRTDVDGIIRLDGLHPLSVTLTIDAEALADELKTRRPRADRQEPPRTSLTLTIPSYGTDRCAPSPVEVLARDAGHGYTYLRIGQLCDRLPTLQRSEQEPDSVLDFHFPDPLFSGCTRDYEHLNQRHVLELCPFRAWALVLHHQGEYSLTNAYNLGLMSLMAYSKVSEETWGSPKEFFHEQCTNLSRTPAVMDNGQVWTSVVTDVSFDDRYLLVEVMDTENPATPGGDTQLFYAVNDSQVIVAWRGTEIELPLADLKTDIRFRPVEFENEAFCIPAVKCEDLILQGRVHLGFKEAYDFAKKTHQFKLIDQLSAPLDEKNLFICGHSLGGALGLLHSAELRTYNPLLYTYGSPRALTLKALPELQELWHFRHINDNDVVPRLPPAADLDNHLYDLYGNMGTLAGTIWSTAQWAASSIKEFGDPYTHHGEIAILFRVEQHASTYGPIYQQPRNLGGRPYQSVIHHKLPNYTKLLLVPSLCSESNAQIEQHQRDFCRDLDDESKDRYFPLRSNPKVDQMLSITTHFMWKYLTHIRNQLMECIDPSLMKHRVQKRKKFENQMWEYSQRTHPDQLARNQLFLHLQNKIGQSLHSPQIMDGGKKALQRFSTVTDPESQQEMEL